MHEYGFYDDDGERVEATTRTAFDEVADAEDGGEFPALPLDATPTETLQCLVDFIIPAAGDELEVRSLRAGFRRFCIVALLVRPDLRALPLPRLAAMCECSTASLSLIMTQLSDCAGAYLGAKSHAARAAYRERAANVWRSKRLKERMASKAAAKATKAAKGGQAGAR